MEISNIGVLFGASIGMFVIIGDVAPTTMISLFALDCVSVRTVDRGSYRPNCQPPVFSSNSIVFLPLYNAFLLIASTSLSDKCSVA